MCVSVMYHSLLLKIFNTKVSFLTIRGTVKLHSFSLIYVSFINCGVGFDDIYDIGERSRSNIEMGGLYIHSN